MVNDFILLCYAFSNGPELAFKIFQDEQAVSSLGLFEGQGSGKASSPGSSVLLRNYGHLLLCHELYKEVDDWHDGLGDSEAARDPDIHTVASAARMLIGSEEALEKTLINSEAMKRRGIPVPRRATLILALAAARLGRFETAVEEIGNEISEPDWVSQSVSVFALSKMGRCDLAMDVMESLSLAVDAPSTPESKNRVCMESAVALSEAVKETGDVVYKGKFIFLKKLRRN